MINTTEEFNTRKELGNPTSCQNFNLFVTLFYVSFVFISQQLFSQCNQL